MEAAVERRDVDENRVPLDSPVELSHEGFKESFEADGVNVSAGGVSMRASYLPSVGARLRCRIPTETAGGHIEAGAEVVWSADQGPHNGEFGLRFLDIDDASARAIRSMLSRGPYLPPSPKGKPGAEDTIDEARPAASVSLGIDGVPDSIRASVVSEDPDILTVSQELPFLRLATGVTVHQDGRRGRIEGIDLTLDGDTPKLLIDILFEEAPVDDLGAVASDSTIPDFLPLGHEPPKLTEQLEENLEQAFAVGPGETVHTAPTAVDLSSPPAREPRIVNVSSEIAEAKFQYENDETEEDQEIQETQEIQEIQEIQETQETQETQENLALEASAGAGAEADSASVPNLEATPTPLAETAPEGAAIEAPGGNVAAVTAARAMTALRTRVDALRPRIAGAFGKLSARSGGLRAKIGPHTVALRAKVTAFFAMLRTEALPRVTASVRRTGRVFARTTTVVRDKVGQKIPLLARRAKRRRKTAPPPIDSNIAGRRSSRRRTTAPAPRKDRRRTMVVSFVAFSGVALAVWALTPGADPVGAADPLAGHQSIVGQSPAPSPAAAPAAAVAPAAAPVAAVAVPPVVGEPAMPRAVGEGSREAGPMAAPTFPSLRDGAHPQAPQALPEGSPYAVDVREGATPAAAAAATSEGAVFGAPDIENGRSFLIRMSQPVTVIRGTARADGFTVEVPSSLSLDRAGPIAASHPLVERSMILNRGDHSELTISFVSGRTPAYRVSARGSAIEVLIARR